MNLAISKYNRVFITFNVLVYLFPIFFLQFPTSFHFGGTIYLAYSLFMSVLAFRVFEHTDEFAYERNLLLFGILNKILFVFIFAHFLEEKLGVPFLSFKDDYMYDKASRNIYGSWQYHPINVNPAVAFSRGFYSGFPNISAFLMLIFGDGWWVPRIANAFASGFTVIIVYRMAKLIYGSNQYTRFFGSLLCFSPVLVTFSSLQLKDTFLLLFMVTGAYLLLLSIYRQKYLLYTILATVVLMPLVFFRPVVILAVLGGYAAYRIFFPAKVERKTYIIKVAVGVCIALVIFFAVWHYFSELGLLEDDLFTYIDSRANSRDGEAATLPEKFSNNSAMGIVGLLGAPLYFVAAFFTPIITIVDIDSEVLNYAYAPLLWMMVMKYFIFIFLIGNKFKALKQYYKPLFFPLFIYAMYKGIQATSISIFDLRQSLPAEVMLLLAFPGYFILRPTRKEEVLNTIYLGVMLLCIGVFTYVRLTSRGLI
ncbi:glycosyltransferase family 39 protein [Chitinophaga pendula]|uniref:glycosyltransferase family 39 protein n=1 Tax=Chitinophaga TaxID=79328 RepID=UPI000BAF7924|nr:MULTISPECIES: glycosyltransferase family 39 protein [Chitinophaga]ASZ12393.1 hypothetical protein CK934_16220 [Chitinophaga sp. MD30]UCJ10009.1 glycosyltransferase family 39 protein [Chitinophaga pendula]